MGVEGVWGGGDRVDDDGEEGVRGGVRRGLCVECRVRVYGCRVQGGGCRVRV